MNLIKDPAILKALKSNATTTDDVASYLLKTYPATEIAKAYASILCDQAITPERIVITEEQFKTYFRVQGYRTDGTPETRGKKK